jgi:hypothetical protein
VIFNQSKFCRDNDKNCVDHATQMRKKLDKAVRTAFGVSALSTCKF